MELNENNLENESKVKKEEILKNDTHVNGTKSFKSHKRRGK